MNKLTDPGGVCGATAQSCQDSSGAGLGSTKAGARLLLRPLRLTTASGNSQGQDVKNKALVENIFFWPFDSRVQVCFRPVVGVNDVNYTPSAPKLPNNIQNDPFFLTKLDSQ